MLEAIDIVKSYNAGGVSSSVLRGVNLRIEQGEFVAVTGRSGSGKSTLLNVLSTLTEPDSGQVLFEGADLRVMREKQRLGQLPDRVVPPAEELGPTRLVDPAQLL